MERIAIYGKGGVGKSVCATSLSSYCGKKGLKVLHVGCDPKRDSAVRLLPRGQRIPSVLEVLADNPHTNSSERILHRGRHGVICCEAGGPSPGLGCGGRGVAKTIEFLDDLRVLSNGNFDVAVFDVLGDVVCGGFAAPLRQGFAEKIFIVICEEPMALYAANNISKAIITYKDNGVYLGGFIANLRSPDAEREQIEAFAARLSSRVVTYVPREVKILQAERECTTIMDYAPETEAARALASFSEQALAMSADGVVPPTPLADEEFFAFIRGD